MIKIYAIQVSKVKAKQYKFLKMTKPHLVAG